MSEDSTLIRVILADDHRVVRTGIRYFLEQAQDVQVIAEADDGEQVLALLDALHPDVIVLDIEMPKLSGIEVARCIRARRNPVGILVLTAYDDDAYITAVLRAGANGFVLKTAGPLELIAAVRDVYQGKSVIDSVVLPKLMSLVSEEPSVSVGGAITHREMDILTLAGRGLTNKAIGVQLNISDRTVQGHLARIFEKLQVNNRTEAVMRAVSFGWLSPDLAASGLNQ